MTSYIIGDTISVACGYYHTMVLTNTGLYATGYNYYGQLGLNNNNQQTKFVRVPNINNNIISVACGAEHTMMLTTNGLYAAGRNDYGQLGLGNAIDSYNFVRVPNISGNIISVACGAYHTMMLTTNGLYATGYNYYGQLGLGTTGDSYNFVSVPNISGDIISVACGAYHTMMLTTNGLYATGLNNDLTAFGSTTRYGQLGLGTTIDSCYNFVRVPNISGDIISVACGRGHTILLTTNGLYAAGSNSKGQLGLGNAIDSCYNFVSVPISGDIISVACGRYYTMILTTNGLYGTGYNNYGQLGLGTTADSYNFVRITNISGNIISVACGHSHTIVTNTAELYVAGLNNNLPSGSSSKKYGQLGVGTTIDSCFNFVRVPNISGDIISVACGENHTMMLATNGLYAAGLNSAGQLGLNNYNQQTNFVRVTNISGDIISVSCGAEHTMMLTTNGLYAAGRNNYGQLGLGTTTEKYYNFVSVPNISGDIISVACGAYHTMMLTTNGLYASGLNNNLEDGSKKKYGQLGLGTTIDSCYNFVSVPNTSGDIISVACGAYHTMMLTTNGLYGTGINNYGQLGLETIIDSCYNFVRVPNTIGNIISVACGAYHTIILKTDEYLYGTGNNDYGQLGTGTINSRSSFLKCCRTDAVSYLTNIISVSCGYFHTMVLNNNGLYATGSNTMKTLTIQTNTSRIGQLGLGLGETVPQYYTTNCEKISLSASLISVACGGYHTMLLTNNGLYATGYNFYGQLALGNESNKNTFISSTSSTLSTRLQYGLAPVVTRIKSYLDKIDIYIKNFIVNSNSSYYYSVDDGTTKTLDGYRTSPITIANLNPASRYNIKIYNYASNLNQLYLFSSPVSLRNKYTLALNIPQSNFCYRLNDIASSTLTLFNAPNNNLTNIYYLTNNADYLSRNILYMYGSSNGFKINGQDYFQKTPITRAKELGPYNMFPWNLNPPVDGINVLQTGKWIWNNANAAAITPSNETIWFYYTFYTSDNSANLYAACDNSGTFYLNENTGIDISGGYGNSGYVRGTIPTNSGLNRIIAKCSSSTSNNSAGLFISITNTNTNQILATTNSDWAFYIPLQINGLSYYESIYYGSENYPLISGYKVLYITAGTGTVKFNSIYTIKRIFLVGGGAGGAAGGSTANKQPRGNPGNGGNVVDISNLNITGNNTFEIKVGEGGTTGNSGTNSFFKNTSTINYNASGGTVSNTKGSNTGTTFINGLTYGGGGGAGGKLSVNDLKSKDGVNGNDGGGGGGGGAGQYGGSGGNGSNNRGGKGGVQPSQDGESNTNGGGGGAGGFVNLSVAVAVAAGSGGDNKSGGSGGSGGNSDAINDDGGGGGAGGVNTGGGGGGGGCNFTYESIELGYYGYGGDGGSGIVIICYE